jgi:predicted ATP-grasp superfamily ATP-dependent carboligase
MSSATQPSQTNSRSKDVGALVIGGDHTGLAVVRSLGRRGIPVFVIDDQHSISVYSRYAKKVIRVQELRDPDKTVDAILEIGRKHNLKDWVLFPTRDETVMAIARHRDRLNEFFRVTTPDWETTRVVWDKTYTYQLAEKLGIPAPKTWSVNNVEQLPALYPHLPLAIKPAIKENFFYATGDKAWRVETPQQLNELFQEASKKIKLEEILLQEIIPGNGTCQASYCVFYRNGSAHSTLSALRLRQHPREFGRAATYVETVDLPEIEENSLRFLKAINFYGIVEVEYKRDSRDGLYKLLDVNARAWGFHGLGQAAGVDFPYLLFADQLGQTTEPSKAKPGIGWLRLLTDVPTSLQDLLGRHLTLGSYFQSLRRAKTESVFAWSDPLPSVAEFALFPYFLWRKLSHSKPQT